MPQPSSPANWQRVKDLFHAAVELPTEERAQFLAANCEGDAELREAVEKLLRADASAPTLLEHSPLAAVKDSFAAEHFDEVEGRDDAARRVGHYRILRELGRGGMGTVYEAVRDDDEFEQRVALKLIRRGMDTEDVRRRFRSERQILASLEHPNIARLLDGGTTADGLPFFVMEFVAGEDLIAYCDARNLSTDARLALFRKVCAAVSYAHGRLVVHRDLKPSNILVTADGEPKLLDFGISKLLTPDADAHTGTATALGMMTPDYASPEQFRGEQIATASDVYSLGVILFKLLTGRLPYELKNRAPEEMSRVVCHVQPERPSDAVTRARTETSEPDTDRRTDERARGTTARSLRGDLDNVVLKALRKEPERRYTSVERLSDDLRRHLAGLPVAARPDTFSYRAEKFIKRNRAALAASVLLLLTLVGGIVGTTWQAVRAGRQRQLAEKRFAQVRQLANNVVFKYYDEVEKLPDSTKAREMLVTDALSYLDALAQDAGDNADLQRELGQAYLRIGRVQGRAYNANLGDTSGAIQSYGKGIALLDTVAQNSGDTKLQADLVGAYSELATAQRRQGDAVASDATLRRAIALNESFHAAHPEDATLAVKLAVAYVVLGDSLPRGKGAGENIAAYQRASAASADVLRRDPAHVRANNLSAVADERTGEQLLAMAKDAEEDDDAASAQSLREEAGAHLRRMVETSEKLVRLQPEDAVNARILKTARADESEYFFDSGQYDKALQLRLAALEDFSAIAKSDPNNQEQKLDLAEFTLWVAKTYARLGDARRAETYFDQTFHLLDELTRHDPKNFDYIQKRFEGRFARADELLAGGDTDAARQTYEAAFAEIETAARSKDAAFAESLRAYTAKKIGDCDLTLARKTNLPASQRRTSFDAALSAYRKASEIWQANGAQFNLGVAEPNRLASLKRKIDRVQRELAAI